MIRSFDRTGAVFASLLSLSASAQDCATWTLVGSTGPAARVHHAIAYDSQRDRVVIFGGSGDALPYFSDTWEWDGNDWMQVASTGPEGRVFHTMAFDQVRNRVVLFGGSNAAAMLGDTWEWDGTSWTLKSQFGPAARGLYAMVYDVARQRVVLFGGSGPGGFFGDTWEWDGDSWTQKANTGPPARHQHAMAYDVGRERVVMFGGFGTQLYGDTWEWNGETWSSITNDGPAPRVYHSMAFDLPSARTILYGGNDGIFPYAPSDTWEWDGADWVQRYPKDHPSGQWYPQMTYAGLANRIIVFGGYEYGVGVFGDTWRFELNPAILQHPSNTTMATSFPASMTIEVTSPESMAFRWRKSGIELRDSTHIFGATTARLTINPVRMSDAGPYDCVVAHACGSITSQPATLTVICYGDVSPFGGDGVVNVSDLLEVIGEWGPCGGSCPGDISPPLNGNGIVNVNDLLGVISAWGPCP